VNGHPRSAGLRFGDLPAAAGRGDDRIADRQPKPGPAGFAVGAVEAVEDLRPLGGRDTGSAVVDRQPNPPVTTDTSTLPPSGE